LGYTVIKLDRVSYAGLTKKNLPRGKWRFLTDNEIRRLKYFDKPKKARTGAPKK
jgi:23S rRNA pseudouridine2605 synthase